MHDQDHVNIRHDTTGEDAARSARIFLQGGRSSPTNGLAADERADTVIRLERFVASCGDVDAFRFDGMTVHAHDGSTVRGVGVHAIVECRSNTWLINGHDDARDDFWATLLLRAAATQLGFRSRIVTSMAIECASRRFMTLVSVSRWRHLALVARDIECIAAVFEATGRPTLEDVEGALGGDLDGWTRALAAVAQGFLRLSPHAALMPWVCVHPGPMLRLRRSPGGGTTAGRPSVIDGIAA